MPAHEWTSPMHSWTERWFVRATFALAVVGATFLPASATSISAESPGGLRDAITQTTTAEGTAPATPEDVPDAAIPDDVSTQETEVAIKKSGNGSLGRRDVEPFQMVGVTWEADANVTGVVAEVQVRTNGEWSDWTQLATTDVEIGRPGTDPMWLADPADGVAVRVTSETGTPTDVQVSTINPAGQTETAPANASLTTARAEPAVYDPTSGDGGEEFASTGVSQPTIVSRAAWGAGNGLWGTSGCTAPQISSVSKGIVLHHTAGSNTAKESESEKIIRGYQTYHVKSRGWCDIGYAFLVDRWGRIYEGRKGGITKQVTGAHAGVTSVNKDATSISMMGNFDVAEPPAAMKDAVVRLAAWRLSLYGSNANGTYVSGGKTYKVLNGHRDVKSTACPGRYGYRWLNEAGGMRARVAAAMNGSPVKLPVPTGVEAKTLGDTTATIRWDEIYGAEKYRVVWLEKSGSTASLRFVDEPEITFEGLKPGTEYVYTVSAMNKDDVEGVRTANLTFVTRLGLVRSIATAGKSSTQTTISWQPVAGASNYRLVWREKAGTVGYLKMATGSSVDVTGLKPGTEYVFTLSAMSAAGIEGLRSATLPFTTLLPKVTGITTSNIGTDRATLSWDETEHAEKYRLVYRLKSSTVGGTAMLEGTSHTFVGLNKASEYVYTLSAMDAQGREGDRSATLSVTTKGVAATPAPKLGVPSGIKASSVSASGARLSWNPVAGAKSYRIVYVPSGGAAKLVFASGSSQVLSGLSAGTTYRYTVSAMNADDVEGVRSATMSFKTSAATSSGTMKNSVTVPSSRNIVFKGHGFGHGIGMSQHGAQGAAKEGVKYDKILSHYYPRTKLDDWSGYIRVNLTADSDNDLKIEAVPGLKFATLSDWKVVDLPESIGGKNITHWKIKARSGDAKQSTLQYKVGSTWHDRQHFTGGGQFHGPAIMTLIMENDSKKQFRNALRSMPKSATSSTRHTVNVLLIDDYVKGVVAREMPSSWEHEALKAQSVAARTYGVRSIEGNGAYDICDTTSCQVYGGVSAETANSNKAVDATKGKILTYGGKPAFTQFSSSSGGWTNKGSQPYLVPVRDDWDNFSGNKVHNWTLTVKASTIEKKYSSIGTLKTISITKRNGYGDAGGRVLSVTFKGSKGSKTITGIDARWAFGMRSDWFGF
ncbi:MAG: SpoIID/LytB domain-containing protein [Aeromicrobium sp.]|nr:MAG: SpoIID/LytB domain-containing protein [Aeromicrobium sp.]